MTPTILTIGMAILTLAVILAVKKIWQAVNDARTLREIQKEEEARRLQEELEKIEASRRLAEAREKEALLKMQENEKLIDTRPINVRFEKIDKKYFLVIKRNEDWEICSDITELSEICTITEKYPFKNKAIAEKAVNQIKSNIFK